MLAEYRGEVGKVGEANGIGHLGNIDFLLTQQSGCLLQADVADKLAGRDTRHFLHLTVQLGSTDAHLLGKHVDIEVAVGEVFVDHLHDTLHEQLVITLHLRLFNTIGLLLGSAVLTLQTLAVMNEVVDNRMKFLHVERLGQEGIGTSLQSLKTIADVGLGCEHDNGKMRDVRISLDHAEHRKAVHLRHHHIAEYKVVLVGKQFLQALLAVGTGAELVIASKFRRNILPDFGIIVNNEYVVFRALDTGIRRLGIGSSYQLVGVFRRHVYLFVSKMVAS